MDSAGSSPPQSNAAMTPEEMGSRLLYRDGLMLIIDKPAGLAVHRGPKGGPSLEDYFDALRFGLPRRRRWRTGSTRRPPAAWCSAATARRWPTSACCSGTARSARPTGRVVEGGPAEAEGRIDLPLGRLDDSRGWWMKPDPNGLPSSTTWKVMGARPADGTHLARARAAHRPHASVARALRRDGLADPRRQHLRQRAAQRRAAACTCTRARSWCRSTRTARRSASPRRCRRTCTSG